MFSKIFSLFTLFILIFTAVKPAHAQRDGKPALVSNLLEVNLPLGAVRLDEEKIPGEFTRLFDQVMSGSGAPVRRGRAEVLVWGDKSYRRSQAADLTAQVVGKLQTAGWQYQVAERRNNVTFFVAGKTLPAKRGFVGFWAEADDALILALAEMLRDDASVGDEPNSNPVAPKTNSNDARAGQNAAAAGATVFNLSAADNYVNVMGSAMPKMPAFPQLPKKPGKLRGYVKDLQGNPLQGAYIGVRSSMVGGYYSGAASETDEKGYYEIEVPMGAAHYYAAGYTIDYGEGRAALGLHPADGKADQFASANGAVENFVLLPYGLGDRDELSEKPWYESNYYGGAIRVSYQLGEPGDMWAAKGSLAPGSVIEITLAPDGDMLDGTAGKSFVIRRPAESGAINNFNINNIPVGRYKISARLANGKQLKMRKTGYDATPMFGLKPAEAVGSATILFTPGGAKPISALPMRGNWKAADVELQIP